MRTVVTWRRFADVRPPKSGEYLVICESGWLTTLTYDKEHEAFCWSEDLQHGVQRNLCRSHHELGHTYH